MTVSFIPHRLERDLTIFIFIIKDNDTSKMTQILHGRHVLSP